MNKFGESSVGPVSKENVDTHLESWWRSSAPQVGPGHSLAFRSRDWSAAFRQTCVVFPIADRTTCRSWFPARWCASYTFPRCTSRSRCSAICYRSTLRSASLSILRARYRDDQQDSRETIACNRFNYCKGIGITVFAGSAKRQAEQQRQGADDVPGDDHLGSIGVPRDYLAE